MQNWHQLFELAQITEQERQMAALMTAERRRARRAALGRGAKRVFARISPRN